MKIRNIFQNMTIKQADIFTVTVIFLLSIVFVTLFVEEMYKDYERSLYQSQTLSEQTQKSKEIAQANKEKLKSLLIRTALAVVTLSFILFALFLGLNNLFNKFLQKDTETFLDFFKKAVDEDKLMDEKSIFFKDFRAMVGYANDMVTKIKEQKRSLRELNQSLEERVKKKTADLVRINENLQNEKNFSQELLKSQKEFLRYTVHETNTPLSVILTSIELYVMKHPKDKELSKIDAAAKNIFSIYDDLSYLVKKDHIVYKRIALNFNNFLQSRIEFFREVAQFSLIEFDYVPPQEEFYILFNETKLQRIVDNTLTNAIKYTLPNETVSIYLKKSGVHVEFSVSSRSKAIKDTKKVFEEPYYREEKNTQGFGLGLKLVKSICEEEDVEAGVSSSETLTTFSYRFKLMGD